MRKFLVLGGLFASLIYLANDVFAAWAYLGYNYASQTVSELFAIDTPTRPLFVVGLGAYVVLRTCFGVGLWLSGKDRPDLRLLAGLLIGMGVLDVAGYFFPMHQRTVITGGGGTVTDTMHIVLAACTVIVLLFTMAAGTGAFGKRWMVYSVASITVVVVFGGIAGLDGARLSAGLPTPWIGISERLSIYGYMFWMALLSIGIFRATSEVVVHETATSHIHRRCHTAAGGARGPMV